MSSDNPYYPFRVTASSSSYTILELVTWQKRLHILIQRILPFCVISIIILSSIILANDNELQMEVIPAFAVSVVACLAMMNMRSVREINISKHKLELTVQQWFSTREEIYEVQKDDFITWQEQGGRGANWCFRMHQKDKTKVIFRLPLNMFTKSEINKNAFIEVLNSYGFTTLKYDRNIHYLSVKS